MRSNKKSKFTLREQKEEIPEIIYDYVGLHSDVPDEEFDKNELKAGTEIEMEHTKYPKIAIQIAKDHLSEDGPGFKYYYKFLKILESAMKKSDDIRIFYKKKK